MLLRTMLPASSAIWFLSNDRAGDLRIRNSVLERNVSGGFETAGSPGTLFLGDRTPR